MYIKLSFSQAVVIAPECWGGLVIGLNTNPTILYELPAGISANSPVNEIQTSKDYEEDKKYDYYYDCGTCTKDQIKKALKSFEQHYQGELAATVAGEDIKNSILENLKIALKKHSSEEKDASKLEFINDTVDSPKLDDDSDDEELSHKQAMSPECYAESRLAKLSASTNRSLTPTAERTKEHKSEQPISYSEPTSPIGMDLASRLENSILKNLKIEINKLNSEKQKASEVSFCPGRLDTENLDYNSNDESDDEEFEREKSMSPECYAKSRLAQLSESLSRATTPTLKTERKPEKQISVSAPCTPTGLNHSSRLFAAKIDDECDSLESPKVSGMDKLIRRLMS